MRYPKPKHSYVLPVVTTLAVAAPLATLMPNHPSVEPAGDNELAAVPAELAEVALDNAPEIVLPLDELTGLQLPDLRLSDLRKLPLPSTIPVPRDLPAPPGTELPDEIPLPEHNSEQAPNSESPARSAPGHAAGAGFIADPNTTGSNPDTPALEPGAVPTELESQVGAQVKQLSREEPFSVVALTAEDLTGTTTMVRAQQADGSWGRWFEAEPIDGQPAATDGTAGTEPVYVGETDTVQVLVTSEPTEAHTETAAEPMGRVPASQQPSNPAAPDVKAVLIDPGRGATDGSLHTVAAALPGGGPNVISRKQWGADETVRCEEPTYDDGLGGVTVHHTAGRNDYSKAESAAIVRAIYTYHAKTLGWCDLGYNALVDKYGQVFEGRFGGLDKTVQGAHAGGFNENTSGVALMGTYGTEKPSHQAIEAIGRFIGWRTRIAGLDPKGKTTMYSEGTEFSRYPQGQAVRLPTVFAHRDVGNTSCPGDAAYAQMDRIRDIAASAAAPPKEDPPQEPQPPKEERRAASRSDLANLASLTSELLTMVNDNIIAKYWASTGGPDGPLGDAASEVMPAAQGQQYAKFVNGNVYTAPGGQVHEVNGKLLDRFLELGGNTGDLGLPRTNAYQVPDGLRTDFQNGSLVLNELTGIVTTIWRKFSETQQQDESTSPTQPPGAATSAPTAAPTTPKAPGRAPGPATSPAPVPRAQSAPSSTGTSPTATTQPPGPGNTGSGDGMDTAPTTEPAPTAQRTTIPSQDAEQQAPAEPGSQPAPAE